MAVLARLSGSERARYVARMFARISRRYDRLNTIMSCGMHYSWRRQAADMSVGDLSGDALDVATGTGDFALDLIRKPEITGVVGVDFTPAMLPLAIEKARSRSLYDRVSFVAGDAHALPFPDGQFVSAVVGFGVRNFVDLPLALGELRRVVKPGGRVVVLEIVRQAGANPIAKLFPFYFRRVTPLMGLLFAGEREAYTYLPESVQEFLTARELATYMEDAGLVNVRYRTLALGSIAILVGEKPHID